MATQLARYQGGREFSLSVPSSLARSVLATAQDWDRVREKAEAFSGQWRQENNPATLVDALLAACRERPTEDSN